MLIPMQNDVALSRYVVSRAKIQRALLDELMFTLSCGEPAVQPLSERLRLMVRFVLYIQFRRKFLLWRNNMIYINRYIQDNRWVVCYHLCPFGKISWHHQMSQDSTGFKLLHNFNLFDSPALFDLLPVNWLVYVSDQRLVKPFMDYFHVRCMALFKF